MAAKTFLISSSDHEHHPHPPHVLIFPFLAHGHILPLLDMAILLSQRGLTVTLITTPLNLARIRPTIDRHKAAGGDLRTIQLHFPSTDYGLPENCESLGSTTSLDMAVKFILSTRNLMEPLEKIMQEMLPNCVIYDFLLPWTADVGHKFNIPSVCFSGTCCFTSVLRCCLRERRTQDRVLSSDDETFVVAGLPDRIELTKAQLEDSAWERCMGGGQGEQVKAFREKSANAEKESDGIIVNSFYELEPSYVELHKEATGRSVWTVGPAPLCQKEWRERGKAPNCVSEEKCLEWLGSKRERSVLYISFGSIASISRAQVEEIKMALRNLRCAFIWVIKELEDVQLIDCLDHEEKRETEDRGLIIRGWAPQVVILSHPSIGGFLTHCGWNSIIEAISFGVPMLTWPLFGDQHFNEKLVVQVLGIGVKVGNVVLSVLVGEQEQVDVVKREAIEEAVERVMGPGQEGERMRGRAWKVREMARKAVEGQGGSSSRNIDDFIQFITKKVVQ